MSDILIEKLCENLDPTLKKSLANDVDMRKISDQYLLDLLKNDHLFAQDLRPTPSSTETNADSSRSLVEEIAELDCAQRQTDLALAAVTNKHRDLILDISHDLAAVKSTLLLSYTLEIPPLSEVLSDNEPAFAITPNEKISQAISMNSSILTNINAVLDLLELPTLCKLCVRQGNYQEALDISVLAQTLCIRFPKIHIFLKIMHLVESELKIMVAGLVKLLNTNLKQKNALKIFHILNKVDLAALGMNQTRVLASGNKSDQKDRVLKRIYLNARYKLICDELSTLRPLIDFNVVSYLKRYIEIYREYVSSSLLTFTAIFGAFGNADKVSASQFVRSLASLLCAELRQYLPKILAPSKIVSQGESESESQAHCDGLIFQIIYLCKSLDKYGLNFELAVVYELCYNDQPIISEETWRLNHLNLRKMQES